nr:MAG TPA: hypothetical protein [Caudoviricetes sp.]
MFRPMYRQCFGSNPHRYWLLQVFETLKHSFLIECVNRENRE